MKSDTLTILLGLGVLGGLAWRAGFFDDRGPLGVFTAGGSAPPQGRGGAVPIAPAVGSALAPLAATGPWGAAAAGAGTAGAAGIDLYNAMPEWQQQQTRSMGEKLEGLLRRVDIGSGFVGSSLLGFDADPAAKRRQERRGNAAAQAAIVSETDLAEEYVAKVADALARPDVRAWRFVSDPAKGAALEVDYASRAGASGPFRLVVPSSAAHPGAVLAEWSSRVFGRFVREGRGPVYRSVPTFGRAAAGYSTANPQAPVAWQQPEASKQLLDLMAKQARSLRRPAPDSLGG